MTFDTKNAMTFLLVIIFTSVGVTTILADVLRGGQLHVVNGIVGGGLLTLSALLALPVSVKDALMTLAPLIGEARGVKV